MTITPFLKMHGLGNDFVIFDARLSALALDTVSARAIADRHWGIGCDQVIVLESPAEPDGVPFMRIFNPDGSESGACGNATRCLGSLLMAETGTSTAAVRTRAGVLPMSAVDGGAVRVNMGPVATEWSAIPLAAEMDTVSIPFSVGDLSEPTAVHVGNPHVVFFVDDVAVVPLEVLGPTIEHDPLFPERTNVQIVQIIGRDHIKVSTWERGTGITSASGSGACAAMIGAARRDLIDRKATVDLVGGALVVEWGTDNRVYQTGPVSHSFQGTLDIAALVAELDQKP